MNRHARYLAVVAALVLGLFVLPITSLNAADAPWAGRSLPTEIMAEPSPSETHQSTDSLEPNQMLEQPDRDPIRVVPIQPLPTKTIVVQPLPPVVVPVIPVPKDPPEKDQPIVRLQLMKQFKRSFPPQLPEVILKVRVVYDNGSDTVTQVTCQAQNDPYLWSCSPLIDLFALPATVVIEEVSYEGWTLEGSTAKLRLDESVEKLCEKIDEKDRSYFFCTHTVVNHARVDDPSAFKFSVKINKTWEGAPAPPTVPEFVTVATPWQPVTCSWDGSALVSSAPHGQCLVDVAGDQTVTVQEVPPQGWVSSLGDPAEVSFTPWDLLQNGQCTTQDDYHFTCTFTIINYSVDQVKFIITFVKQWTGGAAPSTIPNLVSVEDQWGTNISCSWNGSELITQGNQPCQIIVAGSDEVTVTEDVPAGWISSLGNPPTQTFRASELLTLGSCSTDPNEPLHRYCSFVITNTRSSSGDQPPGDGEQPPVGGDQPPSGGEQTPGGGDQPSQGEEGGTSPTSDAPTPTLVTPPLTPPASETLPVVDTPVGNQPEPAAAAAAPTSEAIPAVQEPASLPQLMPQTGREKQRLTPLSAFLALSGLALLSGGMVLRRVGRRSEQIS